MGYFGRAGDAGRLTKDDMTPVNAVSSRKAGHNRITWTNDRGFKHFRLIQTDVVSTTPDGQEIMIDTNGFDSRTTSTAIMQAVDLFYFGRMSVANGSWYIGNVWMRSKTRETNTLLLIRYNAGTATYEREEIAFDEKIEVKRDPKTGDLTWKSDL
jgi:hypothetical protein